MPTRQPWWAIMAAVAFSTVVVKLSYVLLGWMPGFLIASGYIGGLILWLTVPAVPSYKRIRVPFLVTMVFFVLHKLEERHLGFFPALAKLPGVAMPDASSPLAYFLYGLASAWLLVPFLFGKGARVGEYLAWSFFAAMGVTEVAHFVFPFFDDQAGYNYFPGMASALGLVPLAWWGLWQLGNWPEFRRRRIGRL